MSVPGFSSMCGRHNTATLAVVLNSCRILRLQAQDAAVQMVRRRRKYRAKAGKSLFLSNIP